MTLCVRILARLYNIDIMARLILLLCVLHIWRHSKCEQGQQLLNNDYLFAVGNDDGEGGYEKLLAASQLSTPLSISLDGYSVSSACGSHPSRCRKLLIESVETSNFISKHAVLVPLESGVQILELEYNGTSSNQLSLVTQHSVSFDSVNGNHSCGPSLGIYKIDSDYFTPCIGTDNLYYMCEITINLTAITQSILQPCRQVNINNVETRVHPSSISNIVVANKSLIFLIRNVLYKFYPSSGSNPPSTDTFPTYCSSVSRLLISPQHKNQLLVYCRNQNTILYDLNLHSITRTEGTSNIPYPCSPTAEYIVQLSQTRMEFSYKLNSDGNTVIKIFESPSSSVNFHSGMCFESIQGDYLFVYVDKSVGVYLFNATSENLWQIPNTLGCSESECELPLVYGNRYIVVRNKLRGYVTVFDTHFNCTIINLGDAPLQLVTLISDLPAISLQDVPLISTAVYKEPTGSSNQSQDGRKGGVPLEVVVPVAILSTLIVIILIAIIALVVILIKKRCCSSRVDNGKYELDVKFAKQNHEVVIENHSISESQPIKIVAAELEIEADSNSSYSNPVYSRESFDDHKEMPATVIVFENQVTSDSSSVDHDVGMPHPQNSSEEQTATDLSNSETQNLIEPIKEGSKNDNLNVTASLEDNNPSSDNQGEVIINIHALNNSIDDPKIDSQPESQPVLSTDQLIESGESPPPVSPQFTTERIEQTVSNGGLSKLSTSADQEFENGGQINDDAIERESEGDMTLRDKSTECTETRGTLPPLNIHDQFSAEREDQTVDTVIPSELSLSQDQHFEGGGSGDDDNKNRNSDSDRSENSTEHTETGDPPPQCAQLNAEREDQTVDTGTPSELSLSPNQKFEGGGHDVRESEEDMSANSTRHMEIGDPPLLPSNIIREEQFESGGSINDDNEDRDSDGERSDKLQPSNETTSELPVALNGEEKLASNDSLLSTDHDDAAHISDINGEESGNEDGKGNYGQERRNSQNLMMNRSLGSPSETESSVLESNIPTEKAQSLDISQHKDCTHIDSVLLESLPESATAPASTVEFPSLQKDFSNSMDKEKKFTNTESENPPEDEVISPSTDKLLGYTSETAVEDIGSDIPQPSPHQERTDSNPINQEKEEHCEEENSSQSRKSDFEAPAKELECVVDQDDTGNCLKPGEANDNDNFEAPAKELKHVIDQEHTGNHLDTEEVNREEEKNNKHDFEASAEKLECAMGQEDIGDHHETEEVNGDKRDDSKQGDHLETEKMNGDKGEENGNAFSQSPDSLSVVVDQDNIKNENQVPVDAANVKNTPAHLGSSANLEGSLISSSIKNTSRHSDDDKVLPSKGPASTESDLDMSPSSQEDVYNSTEVDMPEILSIDTVTNQEGKYNNTEVQSGAESSASNELLLKSQEDVVVVSNSSNEGYEEIAPIKCTFVGRTIKTVIRTSAERDTSQATAETTTYQDDNHVGIFSKSHPPLKLSEIEDSESFKKNSNEEIVDMKTSMAVENGNDSSFSSKAVSWNLGAPIQESKFGSVNDEMLTESLLVQRVTNTTLPRIEGANSMEFTSQESKKVETIELQTPEQKFPYKFETVV